MVVQGVRLYAILSTDPEGTITSWNQGAGEIFGYSEDAIIGQPFGLLFCPEDRASAVPETELAKAARVGYAEDERWHLRADGTRFFGTGATVPLRDPAGQLLGFTKFCRDDTNRKRREQEAIRLAEERRLALDAADLGWWRIDAADNTATFDQRARLIYGLEDVEVWSLPEVLERVLPEDRPTVDEALQRAADPRFLGPVRANYRVRRSDGEIRLIASLGQAHFEEREGERILISIVGTAEDITDRERQEAALRENEAWFRELANAMPQIVWAARPDGAVDYYNDRWYDYTGLPRERVGDESWLPVTLDGERIIEVWTECVRTGRPYELEYRIRRAADGAYRWHLGRAIPVRDASGRIARWIGTNTDIHDWKLLEAENLRLLEKERRAGLEAQQAREAAEEANRLKDEFLATTSHELRTPLNAIVGWATLLEDSPDDPETLREGIEAIQRNSRAQAQLIDDILDVARITSGKLRIASRPVRLDEVVRAAHAAVRCSALDKGVDLTVQSSTDVEILADPERMEQVFWNLLSNAIKFTPRGGRARLAVRTTASEAVVTVEDNGEGIDPAFLPHVFERFRQADAGSTRRSAGLGLGLALTRHLVEAQGGRIAVFSAGAGQGATFTVTLPVLVAGPLPPQPEPPVAPARVIDPLGGARILVLDDDADARRVLDALLARAGAEVTVVSRVADAIGLLTADHRFDAVISDLGMPDEDGFVFARRLRALERERRLPRLPAAALTAYTRERDRAAAIAAGFDTFLSKPIRPTELLEVVEVMVAAGGR